MEDNLNPWSKKFECTHQKNDDIWINVETTSNIIRKLPSVTKLKKNIVIKAEIAFHQTAILLDFEKS